ncbi:ATP-binding protein [uncultured Roseivirga sp.]|uniref:PAS domain-containing sensor histidine kinase n=1 Tax=uncultured Roseivirga sp. TaxID=543088 RepID=UPI0030DA5CD5|tara:strand:- start:233946 stop:235385 length:1440 start_codon:yes stop_codon:yes gene_type:complete
MNRRPEFEDLIISIFDNAPYGIISFESIRDEKDKIVDFKCRFINPKAEKITGISSSEMVGSTLLTKMPGNKEAGLFDLYAKVVETRKSISVKRHYEGEHFDNWFEIHACALGDGLTVSFLDISEHEKTARKAKASDVRYEQLFHESIDAIFITNNELLLLETNDAMLKAFGYEREIMRSFTFKNLFLNEDDFIRFNKEFYKNDRVEEFEAELLFSDGKTAICLINVVELSQTEEGLRLYQGIIKDITRKKLSERELIWAEKLSMTGKIARSIAHEVRNPLTNLSLALDQLKDEIPPEVEEADLYIDIIERNSKRIGNLITELLESSKPKSLKLTKTLLNDVVKETLHHVKDRLKLQGMKLIEDYDPSIPLIPLDSDQMKTALVNLFINAIEAMKADQGILSVKTYQEDDTLFLEVTDNGVGIPEDSMDSLFEPFFTAKSGGMGLGLTAVQNIIKSHTGQISATSTVGEGTVFRISFMID